MSVPNIANLIPSLISDGTLFWKKLNKKYFFLAGSQSLFTILKTTQ